jgi:hypothetical protein
MTATEQRHRLWSRCWPHRAVSPPRASFGVPAPYPRRPLESLLVPSSSPHDTTPSDQRRRFRILCCPIRCPHRVFLPPEAGHHNEEPTPGFEPGSPSLRDEGLYVALSVLDQRRKGGAVPGVSWGSRDLPTDRVSSTARRCGARRARPRRECRSQRQFRPRSGASACLSLSGRRASRARRRDRLDA